MGVTFDSVSSSVKQEAGQLEEPGVDECRWWDRTRVHLASDSRARRWGLTVVRIRHLSPLTWVQFFFSLSEPQLPHLYYGAPTVPAPAPGRLQAVVS